MRRQWWIFLVACLAGCGSDQVPPGAQSLSDPEAAAVVKAEPAAAGESASYAEPAPKRPVIAETIAYGEAADRNLTGFLALPEGSFEPPPGVLIIHDGRGLDDDIRQLARRMAGEGFVVLAIDLYGNETATTSMQAQDLMTRVMFEPAGALDNIRQGVEYLRRYALAPKVAAFGRSFGGTWSLQAGLAFPDQLDAIVVYYGQTVTNENLLQQLASPLLAMYAGGDATIPAESVIRFRAALAKAGKDAAVRIYPQARHDFASPASEHYRSEDAEDAWARVVQFLAAELGADA